MKKLLLHIILLSYAVVIFKPVLPYITNFAGHVFFYSHHMATVHYENGQYHLHYEVAKDSKEEKSDKETVPSLKKDNSSNEHTISAFTKYNFFISDLLNKYSLSSTPAIVSGSVKNNYPPPRV